MIEDRSLSLSLLVDLLAGRNGNAEIVSVRSQRPGDRVRFSARDLETRARQLASALTRLGMRDGTRVASLAWNVQEHLEAFWAAPAAGGVLHTLNPRLAAADLAAVVAAADDRILVVQSDLLQLAEEVLNSVECVDHVLVFGDRTESRSYIDYEEALRSAPSDFVWPTVDEHAPAGLCFTSGTTGAPKGVLYTHRQLVLHALTMAAFDPHATPYRDRILALVPMFHAMAWNLPYIAALTGSDLVLPNRFLDAPSLVELLIDERISLSCGVPTIWTDVIEELERRDVTPPALRSIACGGSGVPLSLMKRYEERGVSVLQGWGMTETGPGASRGYDEPWLPDADRWERRLSAGRLRPLCEARIRDAKGELQPLDGRSPGEIELRGPLVIQSYFGDPSDLPGRFHDGWLRTGDIGTIDREGWLRIVDREKDVIKSGGEWISSLELERALSTHPALKEVAVVSIPDERWMERPLACVVARDAIDPVELKAFLSGRVASWWIPTAYAQVDAIPRTATGKADKKVLRSQVESGQISIERL